MTTKKPRKSLDDALATEFVYGKPVASPVPDPEPVKTEDEAVSLPLPVVKAEPVSEQEESPPSVPKVKKASRPRTESTVMSQLIQTVPHKEATVRLTVDLTETQHRKLSMLCARTGRKKAEIVRMLLSETLDGMEE